MFRRGAASGVAEDRPVFVAVEVGGGVSASTVWIWPLRLDQLRPPSPLTCHCTVAGGVPFATAAAAVKVAV
jgi:hypothetical protein